MPHTIYLATFSNGAKPSHWAIFIPHDPDKLTIGKVIHVTGNPATGFFLEFKRGYNFETDDRRFEIVPLSQVEVRVVTHVPGEGGREGGSVDTIARDQLESIATTVQPPPRSPNPFDPEAPNCQNWIRQYVEELVRRGIATEDSLAVVNAAKRFFG